MQNGVPFVDLRAQHEEVRDEIDTAIKDIIDKSSFIGGKYVSAFENDFSQYLGVKEAIAVANGTDALWLGLIANGVGPGDAVITVPNTFIATVEAITRSGAYPLFVDIDIETSNMDINALGEFLSTACDRHDNGGMIHMKSGQRVKAIMPVHLYGSPVDMEPLMTLANQYDLVVVEDACQAHGAKYKMNGEWTRVGNFGHVAGFSFYPGKNLGAMGDGGAVVTNDSEVAGKIRWLRDHGQSEKYIHVTHHGWNSRLDAIQAAVLSAKLRRLDEWNSIRRKMAAHYRQGLADLPFKLPTETEYGEQVYHLFVIRTSNREHLQQNLHMRGIGVGLHYPIPLHMQKAYEYLALSAGDYPNAEESAATLLSLPMHPALSEADINQVAVACRESLSSN